MSRLHFKIEAKAHGSMARAGTFRTLHNEVKTPLFMPVGTHATVRTQRVESLLDSGSQILLANTYHLLLRPGSEVFEKLGGIHKFMNWQRSVLTDSGGFQIFALPNHRRMTEDGAEFLSYVDGRKVLLTPERSIAMQRSIGSDIMMVLDQCVPSTVDVGEARAAMELTHRWAVRSLAARGDSPQSLFGIVQGACDPDLRKESASFLTQLPFDGFAIGGLAVGEGRQAREDVTALTTPLLPEDRPRYLMGVGTPIDLLEAVHRGVDMFDCILPTALAQQGVAFTSKGKLVLRRGVYKFSDEALDPACDCVACRNYSRSYLHHLTKVKEPLGWHLLSLHNIHFYHRLMDGMRGAILAGAFLDFYRRMKPILEQGDEDNPTIPQAVAPDAVRRSAELGDYRVKISEGGFASIQQKSSGEVMHSVVRPEEEAKRLYLDQSGILERARQGGRITVWDVGMGAATNAMVLIRAYEELVREWPRAAALEIVSFENDLDSLRLALREVNLFPYLRHSAPYGILHRGGWKSKKTPVEWRLVLGDFSELFAHASAPDFIFFDPFSLKTNAPLWQLPLWKRLARHLHAADAEIFTYSSSTAVRSTILSAGFYVAAGTGTGPKGETTIALTEKAARRRRPQWLGEEWLQRWERSDARLPLGSDGSEEDILRVQRHPQFTRSPGSVYGRN
ncbi:MAG: tRNA guanosine(34) transglycosylase Tgt [Bdellovibrionales bacterium]|nr:tRNA guanosine(34) transglycosylase Tgt [Bdellovibrionales bacterium]